MRFVVDWQSTQYEEIAVERFKLVGCKMAYPIRVAVVDGDPLFRVGVTNALRDSEVFEIVGVGASANEALRIASHQSPDVMLLDVQLPGGMSAAQTLSCDFPGVKIIMLTASGDELRVAELVQTGARGYLFKNLTGFDLARTIRSINDGSPLLIAGLAERTLAEKCLLLQNAERDRALSSFKPRETQIINHVSRGLTNKEVAGLLGLSEQTVKNYMTGIMRKLKVHRRSAASLCVSGHQSRYRQ